MNAKLEMAHDYLLKIIPESPLVGDMDIEFAVDTAWKYADAMQAELDKRNKTEAAQKRKEIREMLNAPNTFAEREGQHFDDVCSDEIQAQRDAELYGTGFLRVTYDSDGVKYERLNPKTTSICSANMGLDSQVLKEWQPDWSQAPEWANWWVMTSKGVPIWIDSEPRISDNGFYWCLPRGNIEAPSFNYQGNWEDSLRERPL